jgi:SAM-dependent MidA family methyltransferase
VEESLAFYERSAHFERSPMPGKHPDAIAPSAEFLALFREHAGTRERLRFDAFMRLALYHPQLGYYRQNCPRVGRRPGTDFYTATSSGSLFGELVCAACEQLLGRETLSKTTFVEIGPEPSGGILTNMTGLPFAGVRTIRVGEPLTVAGLAVVFSNELFDAQPFRRWVKTAEGWKESWIVADAEGLREELDEIDGPSLHAVATLPTDVPVGYRLDLPFAARELATELAGQPWRGLFLAFDYGKSWAELVTACPQGTGRAYFKHEQERNLLARPGEQDLTCHVCWDWLADTLSATGFDAPQVQSQEAFFMHHANSFIAQTIEAEATKFSARKMGLLQLLHPGNMGQKFQVLSAKR